MQGLFLLHTLIDDRRFPVNRIGSYSRGSPQKVLFSPPVMRQGDIADFVKRSPFSRFIKLQSKRHGLS